jgi:serine/threonine-protein kinase
VVKGQPGVDFGPYRLQRRIGAGGMAEVYSAIERSSGARVALKRILPNLSFEPEFIQMFEDERDLLARLEHPNICRYLGSGAVDDEHYIVMELIDGCHLGQLMQHFNHGLPLPVAAYILSEGGVGLDHAHQLRDADGVPLEVVHRDLAPSTLMCSRQGEVKLIDFGIARARARRSETQPGVLKGVFGYMAPEVVRGASFDHRADLFGLGALLYFATTGHAPFTGRSDFESLELVRTARRVPPRQLRPELPAALEQEIDGLLQVDPDLRTTRARDVAAALAGLYAGDPDFSTAGCARAVAAALAAGAVLR